MDKLMTYDLIEEIVRTGDVPDYYEFLEKDRLYYNVSSVVSYELRAAYTHKVSWSLISGNFVDALADLLKRKKCLELYGGYGLLSHQLQMRNIDIHCTDNHTGETMDYDIQYTDVENIDAVSAVRSCEKDSLDYVIASWIPYKDKTCISVAKELYQNQKNCKIIYIGEDAGGCTASEDFFDYVDDFTEIKEYKRAMKKINKAFQSWDYIYDSVFLFKPKKFSGGSNNE